MVARAYSEEDDGTPLGAISAVMRAPASMPTPRALPRPAAIAPSMPAQVMPMPDAAPAPVNWGKPRNEWADMAGNLASLIKKFESPEDDLTAQIMKLAKERRAAQPAAPADWSNAAPTSTSTPVSGSYRAKARAMESGTDDSAVNPTSGATGRYQFLPSTAKELIDANPHLGLKIEDLKNPDVQEKLMTLYTDRSIKTLTPLLGREPTPGELYLTHLLGHSGGPAVLRNLDAPITETIDPAAYKANKALLSPHSTGRQLVAYFNRRLGG